MSVLIASLSLTFLLFFAFVVNVGVLVNAKINLQNAADLAAYAGASVQARQLTNISYLNYEMRRAYKKFLFRYYVVGNMAQLAHPNTPAEATRTPRLWSPNGRVGQKAGDPVNRAFPLGEKVVDFQVPSLCVTVKDPKGNTDQERDNPCKRAEIGGINIPRNTLQTAITQTAEQGMQLLENIRQQGCQALGALNTQLAFYWLYNTDPSLKLVEDKLSRATSPQDQQKKDLLTALKGLAQGLGVVPKELLTLSRIDTIARYLNEPGRQGLTRQTVGQLISTGDAASKERTYQAFQSAFNTLGDYAFEDPESIQMDELLPAPVDTDQNGLSITLLKLHPINVGFDIYASLMGYGNCQTFTLPPPGQSATCVQCPIAIPVNISLPVGVFKDPAVKTFYSVRLKAPAKAFFSSGILGRLFASQDLTLTAYAAATPFGSRVGPELSRDHFTRAARNDGFCNGLSQLGQACVGRVPNLPLLDATTEPTANAPGTGWDSNQALWGFWERFAPQGSRLVSNQILTGESLLRAYQAAMAPNPWELGQYNIPVSDLPQAPSNLANLPDEFQHNFNSRGQMAFWAPIRSKDVNNGIFDKTEIQSLIQSMTGSATQAIANQTSDAQKQALIAGLDAYIQALREGKGEDGEGFNVVRLVDPANTRADDSRVATRTAITLDPPATPLLTQIQPSQARQVKSSFVPSRDSDLFRLGRTGYSVKFVPLNTLTQKGSTGTLRNPLPKDAELQQDLEALQH
jgi:hypothetical protein